MAKRISSSDPKWTAGNMTGRKGTEKEIYFETEGALQSLIAQVIDHSLRQFVASISADTGNKMVPSVSDAIRMMQLRRDLKAEEPVREIEVRWVDPSAMDY